MAVTYKILAQNQFVNQVTTNVYTVPANTSAIISTITVCNTGVAVTGGFYLYVRIGGTSQGFLQTLVPFGTVAPLETLVLKLGITLAATDVITITSTTTSANLTISLFGSEIT
jgi:hypothetical protein